MLRLGCDTTEVSELPRVPIYNVPAILSLRDRLSVELCDYYGTAPSGPEFVGFVNRLCAGLPRTSYATIWDSVHYLVNRQLDSQLLHELVWRLSGNLSALRAGCIVGPWHTQPGLEWVPVHVIASCQWRRERRFGLDYSLRILGGLSCPMLVEKSYSLEYIAVLARRLGFGRARSKYPLRHGSELVNLRFMVLIDPALCKPGQPGFEHVYVTAGQKNWNREVLKKRGRIGFDCPQKFQHECHRCFVGYEDCPAACHMKTFETKFCDVCRKDALFDPFYADAQRCVVCEQKLDSTGRTRP